MRLGSVALAGCRRTRTRSPSLVSVGPGGVQGNNTSYDFLNSISADGRFVSFSSDATTLVPGDTNSSTDVFVRHLIP